MSQLLGKALTEALLNRLNGQNVEAYEGKIIPIFTLDESGWPHPALLSYYEVAAQNASTIDLGLWKNSSTANHLRRTGKVTLMITDKGVNYYLKGSVKELQAEMTGVPQVSRFRVTTEELLEDQESNAEITSGLTYTRMKEREAADIAVRLSCAICARRHESKTHSAHYPYHSRAGRDGLWLSAVESRRQRSRPIFRWKYKRAM